MLGLDGQLLLLGFVFAEKVKEHDQMVSLEQVLHVAVEGVAQGLLVRIADYDLLLLGLLTPEKRDRTADLHVREN